MNHIHWKKKKQKKKNPENINKKEKGAQKINLCSHMEGFWSHCLWFPPLSHGPSTAERQWIIKRTASLCPGLGQCFLWWKRDQSLRWSSWGYKNHTCSLQDCHGPWPYRGSWPQKCKQEFPAMVDTSNSNL